MDLITFTKKQMIYFKKLLRNPLFSVPTVGITLAIILAALLYFSNNVFLSNFLIITIIAFLTSDALTLFLIKEERGILKTPVLGTKVNQKGHAFILFFLAIIIVAFIANFIAQEILTYVSSFYSDFIKVLIVCLVLAVLVYLDMHIKFFANLKRNRK